jgi:hypothetical protein
MPLKKIAGKNIKKKKREETKRRVRDIYRAKNLPRGTEKKKVED